MALAACWLAGCATAPGQPAAPVAAPVESRATPELSQLTIADLPTGSELSQAAGRAYGRFCRQQGLDSEDPNCRRAFLREWARSSVDAAEPTVRRGFARLDELARRGANAAGRKWSDYREAFREGVDGAD